MSACRRFSVDDGQKRSNRTTSFLRAIKKFFGAKSASEKCDVAEFRLRLDLIRTPFVDWHPVFRVANRKSNCRRTVPSNDRGIMTGKMLQKPTGGRLLTALRLAFYPAFESAEARR